MSGWQGRSAGRSAWPPEKTGTKPNGSHCGEAAKSTIACLGDPQLWFESFQNWQSEFLSTAVLVVLSIFLRQRESPESKAVAAPHDQTGA